MDVHGTDITLCVCGHDDGACACLLPGHTIPLVGLGVYQCEAGQEAYDAVLSALKLGYRHIDTAQIYGNEADVGRSVPGLVGVPERVPGWACGASWLACGRWGRVCVHRRKAAPGSEGDLAGCGMHGTARRARWTPCRAARVPSSNPPLRLHRTQGCA